MLHKLVYGWMRIEPLSHKTIFIYADCRVNTYAIALDLVLAALASTNNVLIGAEGSYIVPAYAEKHVTILAMNQINSVTNADAIILLGKPPRKFFEVLAANPGALFAAVSEDLH